MTEKPCKICRLEQYREVLEDMLDVVEEFQPFHINAVLQVLLNQKTIRDQMRWLRRHCPTMLKVDDGQT